MQKAIVQLEFVKVIEQIQQYYQFSMSSQYSEQFLKVHTTYDRVAEVNAYTEMLYEDHNAIGEPAFGRLQNTVQITRKVQSEQLFVGEELVEIWHIYQNIEQLQKFYLKHEKTCFNLELMEQLLSALVARPEMIQKISQLIDAYGTILDSATPLLESIRSEHKQIEQSMRGKMSDIMQSAQSALAEQFYTIRNNRYVLPIKAEYRNRFKGILHDQSASGTTFYIEPEIIVNLNNKLQELKLLEGQEIERILQEISVYLWEHEKEIVQNIWGLARYDVYAAKAKYAFAQGHTKVKVVLDQQVKLYDVKHPLLHTNTIVGNDITLGDPYQLLLITGANTGGKSVFLKSLGLMVLMTQAGLYLPVDRNYENCLGVFDDVFIDIGDEQSLEQNLSTFSGHIRNIGHILQSCGERSLVLLDEIGSGTDPIQGSALAIATLKQLQKLGTLTVATTHFTEVKEFVAQQQYAQNAAMIFDVEKLRPTHKIRYGSYGASYAFDIAKALQFPMEIIDDAIEYASNIRYNEQQMLELYEQKLAELDQREQDVRYQENKYQQQLASLEQQIETAQKQMERERTKMLQATEKEMSDKVQMLEQMMLDLKDKTVLKHNEQAALQGQLNTVKQSPKRSVVPSNTHVFAPSFKEGDIVYVATLQAQGTLLKKQKDKWLVKVGALSTAIAENQLSFIGGQQQKDKASYKQIKKKVTHVGAQLDLRGMRVHEGIEALETYLANASMSHEVVRIVHGHGTGSMRTAVQNVLKHHPKVKTFRFGQEGEGGVGATVIEFK